MLLRGFGVHKLPCPSKSSWPWRHSSTSCAVCFTLAPRIPDQFHRSAVQRCRVLPAPGFANNAASIFWKQCAVEVSREDVDFVSNRLSRYRCCGVFDRSPQTHYQPGAVVAATEVWVLSSWGLRCVRRGLTACVLPWSYGWSV